MVRTRGNAFQIRRRIFFSFLPTFQHVEFSKYLAFNSGNQNYFNGTHYFAINFPFIITSITIYLMENKDRSLRKERNDNRGTVFFFFLSIVPMDMVLWKFTRCIVHHVKYETRVSCRIGDTGATTF